MPMIVEGRVWKFGDNISTDFMMPGFAVKTKPGMKDEEAAKYVMYSNRPGWADQVEPGDIIVGGRNFGCGSSRVAANPLKALGIVCVCVESSARIFFRNSINSGLPVMVAPGITEFCMEGDIIRADVSTGKIENLTTGKTMQTNPLPEDSPPMHILMIGGLNSLLEKELLYSDG